MIKKINTIPNPVLAVKAVSCPLNEDAPGNLLGAIMTEEKKQLWPDEIVQLVQDLRDTAESLGSNCMGLASNQIWDKATPPPAVFIAKFFLPQTEKEFKKKEQRYVWTEFINPEVRTSGKSTTNDESCFSKPKSKPKPKKRECNVSIIFQTLSERKPQLMKFFYKDSFLPIIIQHEYDHLCGKLI